jgi:DNA-binding NarL/FixJ family response regulator
MVERGVPVLVYSMHEDADTLGRALACGASGYVTKRETFAVLLEGVRRVLAGERYISARAAANLEADPQPPAATGKAGPLSEREQQILELLAKGESNAEIAAELNVSVRTVETYFSRILNKLSLDGMRALRKYVRNL